MPKIKKPTPEQVAQLREAYPEGSPRIDYREMALRVVPLGAQRADDADAETATTVCPECGAEIPADATECPECGAEIERAASKHPSTRAASDEAPAGDDDAEGSTDNSASAPIPISISSEVPVLRYDWWDDEYYYEVLDHSAKSVDLSYAADGLPFVASHRAWDADQQHGIVESVAVAKDRTLRGAVRMSRAPRSQEIAQDMRDGIRKKVSVGYIVGDEYDQTEKATDGIPIRRYTQWMPIEVSTVPIPADYTVGVGRAQSAAGQEALSRFLLLHPARTPASSGRSLSTPDLAPKAEERTMSDQDKAPGGAQNTGSTAAHGASGSVAATVTSDPAAERAAARIDAITAMATQHKCTDRLAEWIRAGASETAVAREINQILAERLATPIQTSRGVEVDEKTYRRFSFARALIMESELAREAPGLDFGLEKELMQEARKGTPMTSGRTTTIIPFLSTKGGALGRANVDSATSTTGGAFKFTQPGDFIDLLRNATSVMRAGATVLPGLTGPVTFPKANGAATASWVGENPGSDLTRSNLLTTTVSLAFKTIQAASAVSRQALFSAASGNYQLEDIIRNDLAKVIALAIDLAGVNGSGSSNQPLGLLNDTSVGTAAALGANGGTMAWGNWVDLETAVGDANATNVGSLSYLTNTKQRGVAKKTAVLGNTASGTPIWTSAPGQVDGVVNGYTAIASNQVPRTLTKGTASTVCSAVIFGAFENLLIGMFGNGFEVLVDPYTLKLQNLIDITAWNFVDVANRYSAAFSTIKDAL